MSKMLWILVLVFILMPKAVSAQAPQEPHYRAFREHPPLVSADMRRPGFWISLHPNPDSLFMDAVQIDEFNRQIQRKGDIGQIEQSSPIIRSQNLKRNITDCFNMAKASGKFRQDGSPTDKSFWQRIRNLCDISAIKAINNCRFALAIRFTNQRLIPCAEIITEQALDLEFDCLQNSGFDIAEPIVIYHESEDGEWVFGAGRASSGWFWRDDLVFVDRIAWLRYIQASDFVVSICDKSDLYLDSSCRDYYGLIRLGNKLPLLSVHGDLCEVLLPNGNSAYIASHDVHHGFLPFNARNVYELAFSTLNAPYGWGDLNAEYDCSGFIKQLFQCFGIYLPRNGGAQYKACNSLYEFAEGDNPEIRETIIAQKALPAQTVLRMPGHIMLYLGSVDAKSYALHSLWGIRRPVRDAEDEVIAPAKSIVSDLSLGDGSKRKSLLLRLTGLGAIYYE